MTPSAPWSPTAHASAQHQLSHVVNFWKQGRLASYRLEALPGGRAALNVTFQLPHASEVIPPPCHASPVTPPQRPIPPLFPKGFFPQRSFANSKCTPSSPKVVSRRQKKNYRRSVLHRAALAAPNLPPPKNGSLRQAASASVQRLQGTSAMPVNNQNAQKRPFSDSPGAPSPSNLPPLAQRIRSDIQVGESEELESPEKEILRISPFPKSPESQSPPSSPSVKAFPSPAPLVFTPSKILVDAKIPTSNVKDVVKSFEVEVEVSEAAIEKSFVAKRSDINLKKDPGLNLKPKCCNCDAEMTPYHQCETSDSDGSWEDIESEEDSYPTIDLNSEDWAEKFTDSIRSFHGSNPGVC